MDHEAIDEHLERQAEFVAGKPAFRKTFAEDLIEKILDAIDGDGRAPDTWESRALAGALGCITFHMYTASVVDAQLALTPLRERGANYDRHSPFTTAQLRKGVEAVRANLKAPAM